MTPPPVEFDDPSYTVLRIAAAVESLPGYRFHLQGCEMEVLEAEGFDAFRLAARRLEHERCKGIDWQWRGEALPADALAVIDAALAREPEKSGGEHDDTQSTV